MKLKLQCILSRTSLMLITTLFFILSLHSLECQAETEFHLEGEYLMKITINGHQFNDYLELKSNREDGIIISTNFGGEITGLYTVPGIFTSPIVGKGFCSFWASYCQFEFKIVAQENGKSYEVFYKGKIERENYNQVISGISMPLIIGEAKLSNGELLGTFKAQKLRPEEIEELKEK